MSPEKRVSLVSLQKIGSALRRTESYNSPELRLALQDIFGALTEFLERETRNEVCGSLIATLYGFESVCIIANKDAISCEQWTCQVTRAIKGLESINLSTGNCSLKGLPESLKKDFAVHALVGTNALKLVEIKNHEEEYYLFWVNPSNQFDTIAALIIHPRRNEAVLVTSRGGSPIDDLKALNRLCFVGHSFFTEAERNTMIKCLAETTELAHVVSPHPVHFGHYVQNNLCHLSRLESLGVTDHFSIIYRASLYDFFTQEQERRFFMGSTADRFQEIESFKAIRQLTRTNNQALIASKGSTMTSRLSACRNTNTSESIFSTDYEAAEEVRLCVGVRGGSREAVNLCAVISDVVEQFKEHVNRPMTLYIDGMSASALNNQSTTKFLSLDREHQIARDIAELSQKHADLTVISLIDRPMFEQVRSISTCHAAISHFGSSSYKYAALAGIPVIEHGMRQLSNRLEVDPNAPKCYFLGPEFISVLDTGPDSHRLNYKLLQEAAVPEIVAILRKIIGSSTVIS
jgi:hypothetical protein